MSDRTRKFSDELKKLINDGELLHTAMLYDCHEKEMIEHFNKMFKGDKEKAKEALEKLPNFKNDYQAWYSKAQAVIRQTMPGRLADFNSYYEHPRARKDITFQNYMIRDYLQGLVIKWAGEVKVGGSAAIPEFTQQLNMVKAAEDALESSLMDLTAVLQADLFDSELDSARELAGKGYYRASGAICGVVLEKHLLHVCEQHGITIRKKNPGISDLNQALRDAEIITVPQWRFIQHLADVRNICDHAKGREPAKDEIDDLVAGSEKVLKTVS